VNLTGVTFQEALDRLTFVNRLFYKVVDQNTIIIVPESRQKRVAYDDLILRTFYVQNAEINDTVNLVKTLAKVTTVAGNPSLGAITVLGTVDQVAMAARIIDANDKARGEVVVEVQILEVDRNNFKRWGIDLANYTASARLAPTSDDDGEGGSLSIRAYLLSSLNQADWIVNIPSTIFVRFLQNDSTVRILAAPRRRAAVGKKAELKKGPEVPIPPFITHLTGIDDRAVASQPPIQEVLPAFLEFFRGSVFVAHNARFDFSFLNANLMRLDYEPLPAPPVCTARLARRVVWPDVPNVKLQTLARYFRTRAEPNHRALADAEACGEVLHGLLELGGRLGILTLGDLHEAVRARGRPHYGKIRLADHLPHAPGVYLFRGRDGRVLYVGKSKDLRARVKSYFYGDERKKIDDLLAETTA
jgi:DNA polymerase III epsilon subunit family exonuclease